MIKKILQHIFIITLFLLPFVSSAKIEVTTDAIYSYQNEVTSTTANIAGSISREEGQPNVKVFGGFKYDDQANINYTSCSQLTKSTGTKEIKKLEADDLSGDFVYPLNSQLSNLKPGTLYLYCAIGIENKDLGTYTYGNMETFTTKPILNLSIDKNETNFGGTVTLTWSSERAVRCFAKDGWVGEIEKSGTRKISNIYERKTFTVECLSSQSSSITKSVEVSVIGQNSDKFSNVITLPEKNGGEPEVVVEVTDTSAKLKGKINKVTGSDTNLYGYFRISKVSIPPIFCNDIFGSNMIAVTATEKGQSKITGGKFNDTGEFAGTIYTLEPDTDYAYCAIVSNHPTIPTEIEYGQVVRFRTNPCATCPHTTVRTLRPAQISTNSAILQGNYNSTRNIKTWFEYKPKWGGQNVPTEADPIDGTLDQTFLENLLKAKTIGLSTFNSSKISFNLIKSIFLEEVFADLEPDPIDNEWKVLTNSIETHTKKRNYGKKQYTLIGLSRDTVYQYRIVAETIEKGVHPNPTQQFKGAIIEFRTKITKDNTNPLAHCYNGYQDFGETGVDTGGGCPETPTCTDGIKNQNETGIDSGGVCEDEKTCEAGFFLNDKGECESIETPTCFDNLNTPEDECEPCPPGTSGTYPNCVPTLPTCEDGIQNNDETGIDTGGSCGTDDPVQPSCVDGILNQDETGIDTGGVCEENEDHCFNGIQDFGETDIDNGEVCGNGPRPNPCKNGVKDGNETGIDTGGRCGDKVTVDIRANPTFHTGGTNETLISWSSTNADSCYTTHSSPIIKNIVGAGTPNGKFTAVNLGLNPNNKLKIWNFTATCTGKNGSASDTVAVRVYPKQTQITVNLTAEKSTLNKGEGTVLRWTSTNATSCKLSAEPGTTQPSGSYPTGILNSSKTYNIRCTGNAGTIPGYDTAYIYVKSNTDGDGYNPPATCFDNIKNGNETDIDVGPNCPDKKDRVTVNLTVNPISVQTGGRSEISWTSTNADWCIISNYQQGKKIGTSGKFTVINITANRTYIAICGGEKGEATDQKNIYVYPKQTQITVNLTAEKSTLNKGEGTVLRWTSTNATSCKLSAEPGTTQPSGSYPTGILNSSKTYNITCKGGENTIPGYDSQSITVKTSIDNNDYCPDGWLQADGSCKPTYTCPTGSNGIWPNCKWITKPSPCPTSKGWTGDFWPNCKYEGEIITFTGNGNTNGPCPTSKGWTGEKWPDCKYQGPVIPCPKTTGWSGTNWPDCKYNGTGNCPTGYRGTPPNCEIVNSECPTGWNGTYPNCRFEKECPEGTTGTYPNCKIVGCVGDDCPKCPVGTTGIPPNCEPIECEVPGGCTNNCSNGIQDFGETGIDTGGSCGEENCPVGYTGNPPTCVSTQVCPTGWTGTWPNCTYIVVDPCTGNDCPKPECPLGTTGTWPNCTFTQTCPTGFTGTWPICTSGPTTNIAHCSNGFQDFGETAIDIGGGCGGVYNSGASCFDNIKNGDETGIDEGGHCGDGPNNNGEYPSCFDNIKNGDETGIDIGGHCGNANTGTDWVDVVFPDGNGTGTTTGTCVNGICNGDWEGNFPGENGPFSGSCRAGQYTDCTFTGNCVNGVCTGNWEGNFPGENGPFVGTINGGIGDGRGLGNNDWLDSVFLNLAGEGTINGDCVNGICSGEWKGVCLGVSGPLVGVWNGEGATGPYTGAREDNKCSGKWNGVITGNNGELLGKWKGDGIGLNDTKELYIGYEGIPDIDDVVRYHEGIEHVFIRRIMINTELARHYGYQKGQNLLHFAWDLAHRLAKEFGYVDNEGKEIRVSQPDVSAYQLRLVGDKITVYEYYKNKIIDLRDRTTIFKDKNSYEYYFVK